MRAGLGRPGARLHYSGLPQMSHPPVALRSDASAIFNASRYGDCAAHLDARLGQHRRNLAVRQRLARPSRHRSEKSAHRRARRAAGLGGDG